MALVLARGKDGTLFLVNLWAESEISRVRMGDLWRENGEHDPFEWFSVKSSEEAYATSLFRLLGGSFKQSSTRESGFLSSNGFERVVDAINNLDVSDRNVSSAIDARTSKSQRIARESRIAGTVKYIISIGAVKTTAS